MKSVEASRKPCEQAGLLLSGPDPLVSAGVLPRWICMHSPQNFTSKRKHSVSRDIPLHAAHTCHLSEDLLGCLLKCLYDCSDSPNAQVLCPYLKSDFTSYSILSST